MGAALALAFIAGCGGGHAGADHSAAVTSVRSPAPVAPAGLAATVPVDRTRLAADLDHAQRVIDDPRSVGPQLGRAGLFEQLATVSLAHERPAARRAVLAGLSPSAAATMRANLAAAAALARLVTPRRRLPHWKIVRPAAPNVLMGYFRSAQSRFRVGWQYLAAIEFVETRFGRVQGLSPAGAQGPMQFLSDTWARYGKGNIDNQRDAIEAGARFLVANGAPGKMPDALYRYNNSQDYVAAVQDYAGRMRADRRAFYGYYYWAVVYARRGGDVILPVGYPRARPIPVG